MICRPIHIHNEIFSLGVFLFAVSGGPLTLMKKVYMIDAHHGDILESFQLKSVSCLVFKL